jgi:hypothetical protein
MVLMQKKLEMFFKSNVMNQLDALSSPFLHEGKAWASKITIKSFLTRIVGVEFNWVHLTRRPPTGLLYRVIMRIGRGNRSTRRKPAPVPLCPPQIHMT